MKNKINIYEIVKEKVMFKTKSKVLNISLAALKMNDEDITRKV